MDTFTTETHEYENTNMLVDILGKEKAAFEAASGFQNMEWVVFTSYREYTQLLGQSIRFRDT